MADLQITNHGSVFLLRALTEAGEAWVADHIGADAATFGGAIAVEHRFIADIAAGALDDGLEVE